MVRVESRFSPGQRMPHLAPRPTQKLTAGAGLAGLSLLLSLTVWLLLWLAYRTLFRPAWLATAPALLQEVILLVELAGAATLLMVWAGLLWQSRRKRRPTVSTPTISALYALSPGAFERYVAGLFRLKGYRVDVRGGTGDHGVDLAIAGPSGKRAVVQCKRYQNSVGEEQVRELYGTLIHEKAAHAFLVTTADISNSAREWAAGKPITLIDGETLVRIALALQESLQHER